MTVPEPRENAAPNHLLAPLSLAAYLTWLAIAGGPFARLAAGRLTLTVPTLLGFLGSISVLLLFIASTWCRHARSRSALSEPVLVLLQAPAALLACWGLRDGTQPVLLVMVAAQLPVLFTVRRAVLWVVAFDVPLAVLLVSRWGPADAALSLFSYIGFQVFAMLCTHYMLSAERARDAAERINAELLATRRLLQESTRNEERLRLSRDLHDAVGHKLTALKLQLRLAARDAEPAQLATLTQCATLADEVLADVRGVVSTLRAHEGLNLQQALAALIPPLPHPRIRLEVAPELRVARVEQAEALLRSAQEGLTNALRHSGAATVTLRLADGDNGIALTVDDDGAASAQPRWGNGLRGMHERLSALGGRLELGPGPAGGLRLRAWLPHEPIGTAS